jgi:hypothetical protein
LCRRLHVPAALAHNGKARLATFTPNILFTASQGGEYADAAAREGMLAGAISNRIPLCQPTAYCAQASKPSEAFAGLYFSGPEGQKREFSGGSKYAIGLQLYFRQNRKFDE